MPRIRFLCLAKSYKYNNLCIAGKIINKDKSIGNWFRPVDPRFNNAISISSFCGEIGHIVDVNIIRNADHESQCENFIISNTPNWQCINVFSYFKEKIHIFIDSPTNLWMFKSQNKNTLSSAYGLNNKCALSTLEYYNIKNSLYFIKVDNCCLIKICKGNKQALFMNFVYNSTPYLLTCTCRILGNKFFDLQHDTEYQLGQSYLTISLSEPISYQGSQKYCYKLVAGYVKA